MEDELVSWGRVCRIETRGRRTGNTARATVGFVERSDGRLVVAAGSPDASWALNLFADPACRVTIG
ncbi:MAG: nitroreductase/quinone reductase family protein, partial [Candidatus Limnocylindrales bacterium]